MVTVEDICGGNNLLFLHSLSLTTLQHYDLRSGFPADLFNGKDWPPSPSLIKLLTFATIDLDLLRETQREGPGQRVEPTP